MEDETMTTRRLAALILLGLLFSTAAFAGVTAYFSPHGGCDQAVVQLARAQRQEAGMLAQNSIRRFEPERTPMTPKQLRAAVDETVAKMKVFDVHTHLYNADFGLLLWGVDELITYHYLVAEFFRCAPEMPYDKFWALSKREQADLIWEQLFVRRSPVSEAARGVLSVLQALGIDVSRRDLGPARAHFAHTRLESHLNKVFELANLEGVVMTNDPFDEPERSVWMRGLRRDQRFHAAMRIDTLLNTGGAFLPQLAEFGYKVGQDFDAVTCAGVHRFLNDWADRMHPLYLAVSLPPTFQFPEDSMRGRVIQECVLPFARGRGLPFAMMIGVKKLTNPGLRLAGDSVGKASIETVEYLCAHYPDNKFLVTMLSRENQHELCVAARKFPNLMIFGCWWFLNDPSIIEEMTRERIELLGTSFIPQHSDARVLDQLIYKWAHSRRIIADVLYEKYAGIMEAGWPLTREDIERDAKDLFADNFRRFVGMD
jgi:hypothetical protein